MREQRQLQAVTTINQHERSVLFCVDGKEYEAAGTWEWDLQSDTVFCSDVMVSLPPFFEGTRALIHPDDAFRIREHIDGNLEEPMRFLQFRIITSYGDVKTLIGRNVPFHEASFISPVLEQPLMEAREHYWLSHQEEAASLHLQALNLAEKTTATGTWWMNTSTGEMHYSDGMFHLYRLAPQSLNVHPFTFVSFLHPDDREGVVEAFSNAMKAGVPLHLQHRIIRSDKAERVLQQTTTWKFNEKGAMILYGTAQDITEALELERQAKQAEATVKFAQRLQAFTEQTIGGAHWTVNLVTRKFTYSDAFYRMHGLKPGALIGKPSIFLSHVHPDDRDLVASANAKVIQQHSLPDIDYRLVRADGKVRYVRQQGKLLFEGDDMVMACVLEDTTAERIADRRMQELKEKDSLQLFTQLQAEQMAGMGSWWWEVETGNITWSNYIYTLLGYKPSAALTAKHLISAVHPEDKKLFQDNLNMALHEQQDSVFNFRLLRAAKVVHLKAGFRHLRHEGKPVFVGIVQDISHEYTLQEQLTEQARLANALIENLPDPVLITDENNTVLLWNHPCEDLFGRKADVVLHQNFFDVFPQLKTEEVLGNFNKVLRGAPMSLPAFRSTLVRGRIENILMLPLRNELGAVNGILHVLQDVTKQQEIQLRLSERLNFIESLVEASVDRIIVMDRHMNYLYCNGKAAAYYGVSKEDIIGKNVLEIFPDAMNKPSFEHFRRALKGETVQVPAIDGFTEDHYDQVYLVPIHNERGDVNAVLWMHHDLSHEIKLRRQLEKSEDLLNNIKEAYIELDEEALLQFVNPQAEALWNKTSEDLIGRRLVDVFPVLDQTPFYEAILQAIRERKELKGDFMSPILNQWVHLSATPYANGIILLIRDIDEVKAAHDQLRRSEAMLREAEIAGHAGSYELEWPSKQIRFSDGMYRLFGYEKGEITPSLEFINSVSVPEDVPMVDNVLEQAIANKEPYMYCRRIYRADGELRYVLSQGKVVCNEAGDVVKLLGNSQDITALKLTEAELRESKNLLQQTTVATPDAITIYDLEARQPIYLNDCLANWLYTTNETLVNLTMKGRLALIHPDDREALLAFNTDMTHLPDGDMAVIEYRLIPPGEERWVRNRSKVFRRNEVGDITHMLSVLQDITEEVALRQQLLERSLYAETIIDASIDRIIVLDKNLQVLSWNRRCEEIYGLRKEAAIGKRFTELFPKLAADTVIMDALQRSTAGEKVYLPMRQEVYSNRFSELFYIPIYKPSGEVDKVLQVIHDITQIHNSQEALKESNNALEKKNVELAQKAEDITLFTHIASHDLKEPLRKIQLFGNWLLEKESALLSDQGKDLLQRTTAAVQRIDTLIEDLLALSQLQDTKQREKVALTNVLQLVLDELQEEITAKGARIDRDELPVIIGIPDQLHYLFKNLLSNALKFSKPGVAPVIAIRSFLTESEALSDETVRDHTCITFADNGIGFDQKYEKKIFQVFQRLHRDITGTGMGLTICKKIMENHKGMIRGEGKIEEGAVFSCYFPLSMD